MKNNISIGKEGEALAASHLLEKGYEIIQKNFRYKKGEIDIIAKKDHTLIFVEVKYRRSNFFGFPEEMVNTKKEKMIINTADHYIFDNDWHGDIRFDIVAIGKNNEILHIEDAFA